MYQRRPVLKEILAKVEKQNASLAEIEDKRNAILDLVETDETHLSHAQVKSLAKRMKIIIDKELFFFDIATRQRLLSNKDLKDNSEREESIL